ncbi:hypothetical protein B0H14DRAFT_3441892 [Mycena olivaceomarginata]|nr:hypothetical protein B0H14DRAFT_3441892 [Mycena olivaceomarginata]
MDNYIPASIQTSEQLKHYKHAEAQRRYRERPVKRRANGCNSYDPEHPARRKLRQRPPRSVMPVTPTIVNRRPSSSLHSTCSLIFSSTLEYAQKPPDRKFIAKFGADAFFNYYVPQHKLRGADFLPGLAREYAQQLNQGLGERDGVKEEAERVLMMSSPEWDQSRAQSQPLSDPNLVLCLIQMACPMPFFPNSTNYVGTGEHDKNPRKYWYLVLNQGVFTKKTDADTAAAGSAKVYIFFTRNDARNKWAKNCIRRHAHDGDAVLDAEGDGASASSEDDSAPPPLALLRARPPAGTAARRTPLRMAPKATPPPKRKSSRKEFVLPLYRDDTPPLEMEVDPAPIVERTPIATPVKTRETPPVALSSSVSSVSSLSPTSSEGASASALRAAPPALRFPRRAPASTPANGASAPLPRAAARACTPGGSASAAPRSQAQPAGSRLPFSVQRDEAQALQRRAMEEMADTDTVQVVDYQDAVRGKRRSRVVGAKRSADEEAARVNARATAKKRRETRVKNLQGLVADLDKWQEESEERAQELSETYGMKLKEVRAISALMAQLNEDRDVGHRYLMTDIKRMVKEDPSMLDGFTKEEEEEMVAGIREKRETKHRGARANNLAASADAKRTVERLMEEITGLAERSGMIGFAMFTRGHVHDSSIPVTIES